MTVTEEQVREQLRKVIDPELFVNIVDLGLIYDVVLAEGAAGEPPWKSAESTPESTGDSSGSASADSSATDAPEAAGVSETTSAPAAPESAVPEASGGENAEPDSAPTESSGVVTHVKIDMTMTSPMCPAGPQLVGNSKQVVGQLEGVGEVEVRVVMDPPWTPDKMTEDARDQLGIF